MMNHRVILMSILIAHKSMQFYCLLFVIYMHCFLNTFAYDSCQGFPLTNLLSANYASIRAYTSWFMLVYLFVYHEKLKKQVGDRNLTNDIF